MISFGTAQPPPRLEDRRLLTGAGRFIDDLVLPGELHVAILRSPHAHAHLVSVDTAAAAKAPGVIAVVTGSDLVADRAGPIPFIAAFKRPDGGPMAAPPRWPLAHLTVRHVGEAVAPVVAATAAVAHDALELIAVEYEELPAVIEPRRATEPDAPLVWPAGGSNVVAATRVGDTARVEAAITAAAHVVRLPLINQRLVPNPIEPRGCAAEFDAASGRVTLHTATQNPTTVRNFLAEHVLRVPAAQVRVRVPDIGGGFGMKVHLYAEEALVAWLARRLGRPVKWRGARSDDFLAANHGRDHLFDATLALDAGGRITALRVEAWSNVGAYLSPTGVLVPLLLMPKVITGVYDIPAIDLVLRAVQTHTMSIAPYRGAGRPEAIYLIERLIEEAAHALSTDSADLRRHNMIRPDAMPYRSAVGEVIDCGDFVRMLDQTLARADWAGFAARQADAAARGRLLGRGLSCYVEWTGAMQLTETVCVEADGAGGLTLYSATQAMGQGLETSYAYILGAVLGIEPSRIRVIQGDTDHVEGFGSMASRSLFVGGSAVAAGGEAFVARARELGAQALEAAVADVDYRDGRLSVVGTDRTIALGDLAARQAGGTISVDTTNSVAAGSWPNGCHIAEVEVDPETGHVRLTRITTTDDVGRVVHPTIVAGQVHGGIAQGVGQALLERSVYDPQSGQLLTGSLMDYAMPRADDLPMFDTATDERVPSPSNLLGSKGVGESGTVGAGPAVVHAVLDALRPLGVRHLDMPATPERVWRAIRAAQR
jgi:carbon-monoxide dehydrogenase large subunit